MSSKVSGHWPQGRSCSRPWNQDSIPLPMSWASKMAMPAIQRRIFNYMPPDEYQAWKEEHDRKERMMLEYHQYSMYYDAITDTIYVNRVKL